MFTDPDSIVRDKKTGQIISSRPLNPENVIPDDGKPTMKLGSMFRDEGTAGLSQNHDPAAELALRDARAEVPAPPPPTEPTDGDRAVEAVTGDVPADLIPERPKLGTAFDEQTPGQKEAKDLETLRADILAAKSARDTEGDSGERARAWLQTVAETEYCRPDGGRLPIKRLLAGMAIGRPKKVEDAE